MSHHLFNPAHLLSILSLVTSMFARFLWSGAVIVEAPTATVSAEPTESIRSLRRRRGAPDEECMYFVDLHEMAWG